jgi:peptidoglycan/LPS O-acetylase OafA/YrhL
MSTDVETAATKSDRTIRAPDPPSGERFVFIDGLRGVAASAVLLFHVFGYVRTSEVSVTLLPMRAINAVASFGFLGVEIFFVLSGFVIAHSLRRSDYSLRAIANFAVRRSVRLDPPYWATIAFVLLSAFAGKLLGGGHVSEKVSVGAIVAHLFYLQDILHIPQLLSVFWTLCLEVQFYLVFVLVGVAVTGFIAFVTPMLVLVIVRRSSIDFAVLATMLLIALAARRGALSRWLIDRPVQFLGTISYSLYLIHTPVIALLFYRMRIPFGRNQWTLLAFVVAANLVSLAVAVVLYRLAERPSHALAERLGKRIA